MATQVGYSVAGRSRGRVPLCAVCTVHVEMRSVGFLVEPQNQGRRFVSGLASKKVATVFSNLALKPVAMVFSGLASKLMSTVSSGLASKSVVSFLIEPQNQGGGGFPGLGLKIGSYSLEIWVSKSPLLFLGLGLKIKKATVCRLHHKTDGRATAWDTRRDLVVCFMWKQVRLGFFSLAARLADARRRVAHVAPSRRLRQNQVEDGRVDTTGCIELCYPIRCFLCIMPYGHFSILHEPINMTLRGWSSLPLLKFHSVFARLGVSPLSVAYVLVVILHTLIMNVLSSCYMHWMIIFGA
jgi:hypothetical protein